MSGTTEGDKDGRGGIMPPREAANPARSAERRAAALSCQGLEGKGRCEVEPFKLAMKGRKDLDSRPFRAFIFSKKHSPPSSVTGAELLRWESMS